MLPQILSPFSRLSLGVSGPSWKRAATSSESFAAEFVPSSVDGAAAAAAVEAEEEEEQGVEGAGRTRTGREGFLPDRRVTDRPVNDRPSCVFNTVVSVLPVRLLTSFLNKK